MRSELDSLARAIDADETKSALIDVRYLACIQALQFPLGQVSSIQAWVDSAVCVCVCVSSPLSSPALKQEERERDKEQHAFQVNATWVLDPGLSQSLSQRLRQGVKPMTRSPEKHSVSMDESLTPPGRGRETETARNRNRDKARDAGNSPARGTQALFLARLVAANTGVSLHPTPHTPHPTPHTLTPHTPHPIPHTPHPTPQTPHPIPHTPHPTPYPTLTLHPQLQFPRAKLRAERP
jgi:hypothetical protein